MSGVSAAEGVSQGRPPRTPSVTVASAHVVYVVVAPACTALYRAHTHTLSYIQHISVILECSHVVRHGYVRTRALFLKRVCWFRLWRSRSLWVFELKLNTLCRHHVLTPAIIKTQYGPAAWETLVGRDEMWRSLDFNAKASAVGSSGNLWRGNFFLSFLNLLTFRKLYCLCYILKIANQVWSLCVKQCHKNMTWTVVLKQFFLTLCVSRWVFMF